jgi:hypothetical protein
MVILKVGPSLVVELTNDAQAAFVRSQDGFISAVHYATTPLPGEIGTLENARFVRQGTAVPTPLVGRVCKSLESI